MNYGLIINNDNLVKNNFLCIKEILYLEDGVNINRNLNNNLVSVVCNFDYDSYNILGGTRKLVTVNFHRINITDNKLDIEWVNGIPDQAYKPIIVIIWE